MLFIGSAPVPAAQKGSFCLLFVVLPTPTHTLTPLLTYPVSLADETSQAGCFYLGWNLWLHLRDAALILLYRLVHKDAHQ